MGPLALAPVLQEFAGISGEDYFHDRDSGLHTLVGAKGISRDQAILAGADAYVEDGYEAIKRARELSKGSPSP